MPEILRYAGFKEETTFNPETAPEAGFHIDIASATLDTPTETQMIYGGGLGRAARTHRPGFYAPTGNIVYAFDIKTIAFMLKWALGGYNFTAEGGEVIPESDPAANFNLHEIWGNHDVLLPSFTARLGKDVFEHVFKGCVINSLQIAIEGEYCMATADIISAKDEKDDIKEIQNLLLPDQYPLTFHEVKAKIANVDRSCDIKSMTLNIANNLSAEDGRGIGNRHPCRIPADQREITISKNLWYENINELESYWGGATGPAALGSTEFAVEIEVLSGEHGGMVMQFPRFIYTQVQQQPSGRDELVQATEGRAFIETVILDDGTTEVDTDIYVGLENVEGEVE